MGIKEIRNLKICYREETCDERVIEENFKEDMFLRYVPEYKFKPNDVIIDIGAHIGVFSILAASRIKKGKVYAIEASAESFGYLKQNILLNNLSNVFAFNMALSDHKGSVRLYHDLNRGNWGNTITKAISDESEMIDSDTLSNFMSSNSISKCDFMKINCEGAEFNIVLSTPKEVLKKIKIILILYHSDLANGLSEHVLESHLNKCGFFTTIRRKNIDRGWIIGYRKCLAYRFVINNLRLLIHRVTKKATAFFSR